MHLKSECTNCGAATTQTLCAPCSQDRIYEQAQLASHVGRSLRCTN